MDAYSKYAFIGIAHEGNTSINMQWTRGIMDDVISRNNATLINVKNDLDAMSNYFSGDDMYITSAKHINPTKTDVINSILDTIGIINKEEKSKPNHQYSIVIYYAGHGNRQYGEMVLDNGNLSAEEIYNIIKNSYKGTRLELDFIMDSCHSGQFIAHALRTEREDKSSNIHLYDLVASSFPDEESYELKTLQHGVFTYSFLYKGNGHIDQKDFGKAINNISVDTRTNTISSESVREIFKYIQGLAVPNPVTLLSLGKQHTFHVYKSHHVSVDGGAFFSLPDEITLFGFSNTLCRAIKQYEGTIEYLDY